MNSLSLSRMSGLAVRHLEDFLLALPAVSPGKNGRLVTLLHGPLRQHRSGGGFAGTPDSQVAEAHNETGKGFAFNRSAHSEFEACPIK